MSDALEPGIGVALIVWRRGAILLGRRRGKRHGEGTWALPGGKVDPGEDITASARRELLEETGLHAEALREVATQVDDFPLVGKRYTTHFFAVERWSGVLENREPEKCEAWIWQDIHALPPDMFVIDPATIAAASALFDSL